VEINEALNIVLSTKRERQVALFVRQLLHKALNKNNLNGQQAKYISAEPLGRNWYVE